ncbi:MAG: DUF502 domain-containing protein [Waddliaceae bacterium]
MRKHFFTGLATLLPLIITFVILFLMVNFLTRPFEHMTHEFLSSLGYRIRPPILLNIVSKGIILILFICFLLLLGYFARVYFMSKLLSNLESLIDRVPIVGTFYRAIQEMVLAMFSQEVKTFSQAVLVPFPFEKSVSIGFVSRDLPFRCLVNGEERIAVFVPGTPNPSMGFLLMYPKDQLVPLNMSLEDALKAVVSCGVLTEKLYS